MQLPPTAIGLAARAYGVRLQHPAVRQVQPVKEVSKASEIKRGADQLIAGSVRGSAEVESNESNETNPASPAKIRNVLQMYSRAADKIEVATQISVGRSLDVSG